MKYMLAEGQKFNKWTVLRRTENHNGFVMYECRCDCGLVKNVCGENLVNGKSKSCVSCSRRKENPYARTPLYRIWQSMKQRCFNPKDRNFHNYGGRGITVCDEWLNYLTFQKWCNENGYEQGLSIDRINNDGNYEPRNCRWTTMKVQNNNKRTIHWITYNGETKSLSDWAACLGLKPHSLIQRLQKYPIEKALSVPNKGNVGRRGLFE